MRNREVGTKHVFAGGTRLVSKLVKAPNVVDLDGDGIPDDIANGNGGQGNGQGPCNNNGNGGQNGNGGNNSTGPEVFEKDQYYYHPDHLGSSSYVTDLDGEIFQHLEYFPFGETWVEESSNTQRTPYLFTAKELDEETGLYYFGARYYDPRTSLWQSPDPILADYMKGDPNDGVQAPLNLSLYAYAYLRPTAYVDPDGNLNVFIGGAADNAQPGSPIYRAMQTQSAAGGNFLESPNRLENITARHGETRRPNLEDGGRGRSPLAQEIGEYDDEPVNIIGHSWGGAAATRLANELSAEGVEVDIVVTLDPVSRWWSRQDVKDPETRWINIFIPEDARVPGAFPDDIAETGGDWGSRRGADENFPITSWPGLRIDERGKRSGESGHMGILLLPLSPFVDKPGSE